MRDDILLKHEHRRVPRYTSYPTAPHFGPSVTSGVYRSWLAMLPADQPVSLYLHVPFCQTMCWYCGCHTRATRQYLPVTRYLEAIHYEIDAVTALVPGRLPVGHVHWGGGTPNLLAPADFAAIMARLRQRFDLRPDAEIAAELDPRTLTGEMVDTLAACGVNRASLGVQSFDPEVQTAIHRDQTFAQTEAAVTALRGAGIGRINIDLVYGLPRQTVANSAATIDGVASLAPDRLAIYGYAHLPSFKRHQRLIDAAALPDARARLAQFQVMTERLEGAGYVPIGLDHFARPSDALAVAARTGALHRNFQGYTTDACDTLIGFGASAIGALPQGYVQNITDIGGYAERVKAGALPIARGRALSREDRLRRAVIERLMCDLAVDLSATARRHGLDPAVFDPDRAALAELECDGIALVDGDGRVSVPEAFRPLLRSVAAAFDAYLRPEEGRHARAI